MPPLLIHRITRWSTRSNVHRKQNGMLTFPKKEINTKRTNKTEQAACVQLFFITMYDTMKYTF